MASARQPRFPGRNSSFHLEHSTPTEQTCQSVSHGLWTELCPNTSDACCSSLQQSPCQSTSSSLLLHPSLCHPLLRACSPSPQDTTAASSPCTCPLQRCLPPSVPFLCRRMTKHLLCSTRRTAGYGRSRFLQPDVASLSFLALFFLEILQCSRSLCILS